MVTGGGSAFATCSSTFGSCFSSCGFGGGCGSAAFGGGSGSGGFGGAAGGSGGFAAASGCPFGSGAGVFCKPPSSPVSGPGGRRPPRTRESVRSTVYAVIGTGLSRAYGATRMTAATTSMCAAADTATMRV